MNHRNSFASCGLTFAFILVCLGTLGQGNIIYSDSSRKVESMGRRRALSILADEDTISASPIWPNINPSLFFRNISDNVRFPSRINQGTSTNFCSFAALTHLLLKYKPDVYVRILISLYRTGGAELEKKSLKPKKEILQAAGMLKNKGELDVLHANQLWFLTLADQFKGYLNFFDHKYNRGDENKIWAATNYAKFNTMLRYFTNFRVMSTGSDLFRPSKNDFYEYISGQLREGVVILYLNSKYMHPTKYTNITLRAPTHFVVLYEMYKVGDLIEIKYWDYGLKTEQLITKRRLFKMIFGVSTITSRVEENK